MQGFTGKTNSIENKQNDFMQSFIKEMTEQTNNNILKLINIEVIISVLLEYLMSNNIMDKDKFESMLKEKSELVQKDIEANIEEQTKGEKKNNLFKLL